MLPFSAPARAEEPHGAPAPHGTPEGHAPAGQAHEGQAEHGGGHDAGGIPWTTIAYQAVNVTIFAAVLVWLAGRPIRDWLRNRSLGVANELGEAARIKDEATARFSDIEAKLVGLDRRVEEMKAEAEVAAQKEAEAIRQRAEQDAARIRETAERTIREEGARARTALRAEAAALSVQLARDIIKHNVTPDDQDRLAREFLGAVDRDRKTGVA